MNAIQLHNRIELYTDTERAARFSRLSIDNAVKEAIDNFIEETIKKGFQDDQVIADNLYTLQKLQTAAPSSTIALYPADYRFLISLYATIGGTAYYCRPTTEAKLGPLLDNTFQKPSATKPYYIQKLTGFKLYSGAGTVTSADLNYVKTPAVFTIGKDSQLISEGGTLTNATAYYATAPTVYATVSYNIGDSITGTGVAITSGQAILQSNTTACDLPDKTHDNIARKAAEILLKATTSLPAAQVIASEAQKP